MNSRILATNIAMKFIGLPYRWGGDNPMTGFDCSGFCIEILKSVGVLPRSGDWTAHGLWDRFRSQSVDSAAEGCLVFWWNSDRTRIIHVEYCINSELSIGASGGGSSTTSEQAAIAADAYIKVRPYESRSNLAGFRDPFQ
jgi:cell wall-associated NlpC family hydrolase